MKFGHMDGMHCILVGTSILVKIKSVALYNCRTVYVADTQETLILQQLRKIAPNSRRSVVSTFQYTNWCCDFIFYNLCFTETTELL